MNYKLILKSVGVVAVSAFFLVGCGGGDDDSGSGDGGGKDNGGGTYTLTVNRNPSNGGTTTPAASKSNISAGTQVDISATATVGYTFQNWTVGSGGTLANANQASTKITVNGNVTVTANFQLTPVDSGGGSNVDGNGNYTGKTVTIGSQVWMAENLNRAVENSKCYTQYSYSYCPKYGRLYNWATAMDIDTSYNNAIWNGSDVKHQGVCPNGWHLPSDDEWTTLTDFVGGASVAGTKLKATSGWGSNDNSTDDYGFSALPGGIGNGGDFFSGVGAGSLWWSATENDASDAWNRRMHDGEKSVFRDYTKKRAQFSVRCVQD